MKTCGRPEAGGPPYRPEVFMAQRLRESIEELARDDRRFPPDAYLLVFEGLETALAQLASRRHVSPRELVEGVLASAVTQWGSLASAVLDEWNVTDGGDIGDMVFNLVDRHLLVASENDTRADFAEVADVERLLDELWTARLDAHPPRLVPVLRN